jgi:hypothetical protein
VLDFAGMTIPVVDMRRFDERQTCGRVLRYLAGELQGAPSDYQTCAQYRAQRCTRGGLCAFHEADNAAIWRRAAQWRLLVQPDGSEAVTPATSALEIARDLGARIVGAELVEVR